MSVSRGDESGGTEDPAGGRFRFPAMCRLRASSDFRRIYQSGQRVGDDHLLIVGARNHQLLTRIGLSVSRQHGTAAVRNRKKRLMREAFRTVRGDLPTGLDLILIPRQRLDSTMRDFQASLKQLVKRLQRKLPRVDQASPGRADPPQGADS